MGRQFPVKRNATSLRKIIAGPARNQSQVTVVLAALYAVDRFVDAAVAADNNKLPGAALHQSRHLILDIAYIVAEEKVYG